MKSVGCKRLGGVELPAAMIKVVKKNIYRGPGKGLYVVARSSLMVLLDSSAGPCLGPA